MQQPTIGGRRRWTQDEIVAAAHRHHVATGRQPGAEDWRLGGVGRPNTSTVLYHFGSWSGMIRAAGFKPLPSCRPVYWTQPMVIAALQRWHSENGRVPKMRDWHHPALWHPQAATVWRLFGSWTGGLQAAGLRKRGRRRLANPLWSKEDIAAALLDHLLSTGSWPTCHSWGRAGRGHPCASTIKYRFGTWNAAKRYAGWDPLSATRSVPVESRCSGCGGDEFSETIGCRSCWDRTHRAAARNGTPLSVVESPLTPGDSDPAVVEPAQRRPVNLLTEKAA